MRRVGTTSILALSLFVASCSSGGGGSSSGSVSLVSCTLGCSGGACTLTEISSNQSVAFSFNQDIDPSTVSTSTLTVSNSLTGVQQRIDYEIDPDFPSIVRVFPTLLIDRQQGGNIQFYDEDQSILFFLPAAPDSAVTILGENGASLSTPLSCSVTTSLDPIDLVSGPPLATLAFPEEGVLAPGSPFFLEINDVTKPLPVNLSTGGSSSIFVSRESDATLIDGLFDVIVTRQGLDYVTTVFFTPDPAEELGVDFDELVNITVSGTIKDFAGNFIPGTTSFQVLYSASGAPAAKSSTFLGEYSVARWDQWILGGGNELLGHANGKKVFSAKTEVDFDLPSLNDVFSGKSIAAGVTKPLALDYRVVDRIEVVVQNPDGSLESLNVDSKSTALNQGDGSPVVARIGVLADLGGENLSLADIVGSPEEAYQLGVVPEKLVFFIGVDQDYPIEGISLHSVKVWSK